MCAAAALLALALAVGCGLIPSGAHLVR